MPGSVPDMLDNLADGISVEGMESLIPVLVGDELALLSDHLPAQAPLLARRSRADPHPGRRPGPDRQRVPRRVLDGRGHRRPSADRPRIVGATGLSMRPRRRPGRRLPIWRIAPRPGVDARRRLSQESATSWTSARRRRPACQQSSVDEIFAMLRATRQPTGGAAAVVRRAPARRPGSASGWPRPTSARRARAGRDAQARRGRRACGRLRARLRAAGSGLAILTEADLTGSRGTEPEARAAGRRPAATPSTRSSLKPGRLRGARAARHRQVHRHGAAHVRRRHPRVPGAWSTRRASAGSRVDRLFVPTDSLDLLSRYVGGEVPTLNKLGGATGPRPRAGPARQSGRSPRSWCSCTPRAASPGHAFGPDTPWQRELEDAFPLHRDPRPDGRDRRGQGATWRSRSRWTG